MTGGDIYDRLLKSRKRQNPVAFHWPGGPKESKDTGYIKISNISKNIHENLKMNPCSPCFWTMWQNVFRCPTSNSLFLFFLPKNGKNPSRYERLSALLDAASGLSHMHNSKPEAFHRVGNLRSYQSGNLPCWWMTSWFQASQDIKSANILLDRSRALVLWDVFSMKIRWFMFHDGLGTFQQSFFLFCPTGMVPQRWQTSVSASPLKPEMPKVARLVVSPIL